MADVGSNRAEDAITAEFEILEAGLEVPAGEIAERPNPRQTLSDEELAAHQRKLESIVRARERALQDQP
jgi:hypothetical protein